MPHGIHAKRLTPPRVHLLTAAALLSGVLVAGCGEAQKARRAARAPRRPRRVPSHLGSRSPGASARTGCRTSPTRKSVAKRSGWARREPYSRPRSSPPCTPVSACCRRVLRAPDPRPRRRRRECSTCPRACASTASWASPIRPARLHRTRPATARSSAAAGTTLRSRSRSTRAHRRSSGLRPRATSGRGGEPPKHHAASALDRRCSPP